MINDIITLAKFTYIILMDLNEVATCDSNILSSSEEIATWASHNWKGGLVSPFDVILVSCGSVGE